MGGSIKDAGSSSISYGGGCPILVEHPVIVKRSHSVQWKRKVFDLDQKKLATLKTLQGWTNAELARQYGVSYAFLGYTLKWYLIYSTR
jgi:hypothetical protein